MPPASPSSLSTTKTSAADKRKASSPHTVVEVHKLGSWIDVTDAEARLTISIYDRDLIGSDDYMGALEVRVGDIGEGKEHQQSYRLMDLRQKGMFGGKSGKVQKMDGSGHCEIKLKWMPRDQEDDVDLKRRQKKCALRLQGWCRMCLSKKLADAYRLMQQGKDKFVNETATVLESIYRRHVAMIALRRLKKMKRVAVKLQCLFRRYLAWLQLQRLRLEYHSARRIQGVGRQYVSNAMIIAMRLQMWVVGNYAAVIIQSVVRCHQAIFLVERKRQARLASDWQPDGDLGWLSWYGLDFVYGSLRLRRMCLTALNTVRSRPGSRVSDASSLSRSFCLCGSLPRLSHGITS